MADNFLNVKEAAQALHLSEPTVRRMCKERKIMFRRVGARKIEIREDWIENYLEGRTFAPEEFKEENTNE